MFHIVKVIILYLFFQLDWRRNFLSMSIFCYLSKFKGRGITVFSWKICSGVDRFEEKVRVSTSQSDESEYSLAGITRSNCVTLIWNSITAAYEEKIWIVQDG